VADSDGVSACAAAPASGFLKLSALVNEVSVFMSGTNPASSNSWPAIPKHVSMVTVKQHAK
jgi:hypothetical protein